MKGHVPTPDVLAERMVKRLFRDTKPKSDDRILYPGAGTGPFTAAVERVCEAEGWDLPNGYAVENDPEHLEKARERGLKHVEFHQQDFLFKDLDAGQFRFIIGNPPYVPIEGLNEEEKKRYRETFSTAIERFDLYLLFFERALGLLASGGILSFITPEKFEYVDTASPLRRLLTAGGMHVEEIEHVDEDVFTGLITFPCITTVRRTEDTVDGRETRVTLRDGTVHTTTLPSDGESWASSIRNADLSDMETGATLGEVTERISPGIATGADKVFVLKADDVLESIDERWVHPTVSGRQLREFDGPYTDSVFLCPYKETGELADEDELGAFLTWLEDHRERLEDRSCVKGGKKWYAWHENPPMQDLLRPKIVFRDIAKEPRFWAEKKGTVVPKHSIYYAIPKDDVTFEELLSYLNSSEAHAWMLAHCQKAHNGFYRLQSRVLHDLPVPVEWAKEYQATL